jgi:hypothetical protein
MDLPRPGRWLARSRGDVLHVTRDNLSQAWSGLVVGYCYQPASVGSDHSFCHVLCERKAGKLRA